VTKQLSSDFGTGAINFLNNPKINKMINLILAKNSTRHAILNFER